MIKVKNKTKKAKVNNQVMVKEKVRKKMVMDKVNNQVKDKVKENLVRIVKELVMRVEKIHLVNHLMVPMEKTHLKMVSH